MTTASIVITSVVTQQAVNPGRRHSSESRLRGGRRPATRIAAARDIRRGEGRTNQLTMFRRSIWIARICSSQFRIPTIPIVTAAISSMSCPRRGREAAVALAMVCRVMSGGNAVSWLLMTQPVRFKNLHRSAHDAATTPTAACAGTRRDPGRERDRSGPSSAARPSRYKGP